jgi:hypothetical protein
MRGCLMALAGRGDRADDAVAFYERLGFAVARNMMRRDRR